MSGQTFTPREYIEHQLKMTEEEKRIRRVFYTELLARHKQEQDEERAEA